jgi:glycosyltransferase involved in cell wall biosynthesis
VNLLLYSWPFDPSVGGLERLTRLTATYLAEAGWRVTVVTATPDAGRSVPDLPFTVVRRPGWRSLAHLVRRADIVQLNTFSAPLFAIATLLRRPVVWQHIDYDTVSPRGICHALGRPCPGTLAACYPCLRRDHSRTRAARALVSLLLKKIAARLVAANAQSTRYAAGRMPLPRGVHLPFGIDLSPFTLAERPPPPPLRVLFYGRHVPAKGCDVLVRAAATCRAGGVPLEVRIAGDGPHRAVSEALAAELNLASTVTFLGYVSDRQLVAELQSAHLVAIPATQDEIGQLVALEAMSCGCVIIASRIGAFPELFGDSGLLFPPGDAEALAEALARVSREEGLLAALAARGREKVLREFDWRVMGRRYVDLYERVLSRSRTTDPQGEPAAPLT